MNGILNQLYLLLLNWACHHDLDKSVPKCMSKYNQNNVETYIYFHDAV